MHRKPRPSQKRRPALQPDAPAESHDEGNVGHVNENVDEVEPGWLEPKQSVIDGVASHRHGNRIPDLASQQLLEPPLGEGATTSGFAVQCIPSSRATKGNPTLLACTSSAKPIGIA